MIFAMFLRVPFIVFAFATLAISVSLKMPMRPELSSGIVTQTTARPVPSQSPPQSVTPRVAPSPYKTDWSTTTPRYAQGRLLEGLACAPTSVAMVSGHFHALDHRLGGRSPEEIVSHLQSGDFVPGRGVPFEYLSGQLSDMGYAFGGAPGYGQADLIGNMSAGPVIALVDRDVVGRRGMHSVVVVAIAQDGSRVMVNDPATGDRTTLTWESFETMWSGGNHWLVLIRPV